MMSGSAPTPFTMRPERDSRTVTSPCDSVPSFRADAADSRMQSVTVTFSQGKGSVDLSTMQSSPAEMLQREMRTLRHMLGSMPSELRRR